MSKIIKIIAGLLIVVFVGLAIVISMFDVNQYKGEITQAAEDATGRKLEIGGKISFKVSLIPTVVIKDVKFANADWGSKSEMLSLDKFEVQVALLPLLGGNLQVNRVILLEPEILLETDKQGTGNWVFGDKKVTEQVADESEASLPSVIVNEVHIKNANITYKDGVTGKETKLAIEKIVTESDSFSDPLSVLIKVAYNEIPIKIEGALGALNQLTANDEYPVNLTIDVSDATIAINGQVAKPMDGKGLGLDLDFNIDSLSKLSKLAETELPALGPISLTGKLSDGDGSYSIKGLKLQAGKTDLSGDLSINVSGKRPALTANLNANLIDLVELSGGEAATEEKKKQDRLFSSDPLLLEGLKSADANVTINAQQIQSSGLVLDKTKIVLSLQNGNLSIKPLSTLVAGGSLNGHLGLNASGKIASLVTDIKITGLEPSKLPDFSDKFTNGKTDVNISLQGKGQSVAAIMAGSNGKLLVKMGSGTFKSSSTKSATSDLFSSLKNTVTSDGGDNSGATEILCSVINLNIKDGIATADKGIAVSTKKMSVIGSGTIDLKTEKLNINIDPQAREGVGISTGQLAELVSLGGTLSEPKVVPNTKAALKAGLSAGAAVATGGLSILAQGLFDKSSADEDPCATALGQKSTKTSTASKESEPSTTTKTVDKVKDAGSAVTDKLKGFFK